MLYALFMKKEESVWDLRRDVNRLPAGFLRNNNSHLYGFSFTFNSSNTETADTCTADAIMLQTSLAEQFFQSMILQQLFVFAIL